MASASLRAGVSGSEHFRAWLVFGGVSFFHGQLLDTRDYGRGRGEERRWVIERV